MKIGAIIKKLRTKRKIRQKDFAEKCGISQTYLSQIENDDRNPTISVLEKISEVLSIPYPVLSFLTLNEESIAEEKRESYKTAKPILDGIIDQIFL